MRCVLAVVVFFLAPQASSSDNQQFIFTDQAHYELVYEYGYQANYVERLILECTGDKEVWRMFGFATAPLSNAYKRHVLGTSIFQRDPYTNQKIISRLWQQITLDWSRNPKVRGDPADPVLMAQRDVLSLVNSFSDEGELDALCDFIFWEEVLILEDIVNDLLYDAELRIAPGEYADFLDRAQEGLPVLRRLFGANPLQELDK